MRTLAWLLLPLVGLPAVTMAPPASAGFDSCRHRVNNTQAKLLECVTLKGARAHQAALQVIANRNGGNRATGMSGYDASLTYVKWTLRAAGYKVTLNPFSFEFVPPAVLDQLTPTAASYQTGGFTGAGPGDVTADVVPVDINLTPPRASTSGCEPADFIGFPAKSIALVQRGTCSFAAKALNAKAAGASAVVIFNQGNDPTREDLIIGTLDPDSTDIPVVGASYADGVALARPNSRAHIVVKPAELQTQYNLIAELRGNDKNVVMVGAHLDSVQEGPGIQDNGSGSASVLETAIQMAKVRPRNTVRFAWWGGEESGLIGSEAYVAGLTEAERAKIALYLNFDMIGSPNHVFFIYDGDDSDGVGSGPGPEGSAAIEKLFEKFYKSRKLPFKGTDFDGRSDYGPFIEAGIPAGGLFTGAEEPKTPEEAVLWGGTAGVAYDPCYHQACDDYKNINLKAYDTNTDAVAYATLEYAMSTKAVNGVRGKGNFKARQKVGAAMANSFSHWGPQPKR